MGYILEIDLEYRSELHDLHNDYPLVPEISNLKLVKMCCQSIGLTLQRNME